MFTFLTIVTEFVYFEVVYEQRKYGQRGKIRNNMKIILFSEFKYWMLHNEQTKCVSTFFLATKLKNN